MAASASYGTDDRNAAYPPEIPFGQDSYRMLEKWPLQRLGVRAYMRSTYDRTGGNIDASNFLYQQAEDFNVTLDVEGQGALYFVRTNHWHGSPWHYEIDGVDHIVEETTTADPTRKLDRSTFLPEHLFPYPLALTYEQTKGADLNWVPMPFEKQLRLAYSRTFYGTGYYIYHLLAPGVRTTTPVEAWDGAVSPDPAVLKVLERAGENPYPDAEATSAHYAGNASIGSGDAVTIFSAEDGPSVMRALSFDLPKEQAERFGDVKLRITWDGRKEPSVDAPVSLFFGAGTLHNNDGREWLVRSLPVSIRFKDDRVYLNSYFPMPFFRSAKVELVGFNDSDGFADINWQLSTVPFVGPPNHSGYFHATYKDHGKPALGQDLVFLDTKGAEGAEMWSGSFIGTSFSFTDRAVLTTLEGDPRFFFDNSRTPQAQGTGTEEWGGGGDYWGGRTMTQPLVGHPTGVISPKFAKSPEDLVHSAYRFLLADLMPFGQRAVIRFGHGGENESSERYRTVAYWYGLPSPNLVLTDAVDVGDPKSEAAHDYVSPDSELHEVTSRFEWGPDHVPLALGEPVADPQQKITFAFDAPAGRYNIWVETRLTDEIFDAHSLWLEFNDDIGSGERNPAYMGAWGFMNVGAQNNAFRFVNGSLFSGCSGNPYALLLPASQIEFESGGEQILQIQPRNGRMEVGRILLSPHRTCRPDPEFTLENGEILLAPSDAGEVRGFKPETAPEKPSMTALVPATAPAEMEIYQAERLDGRITTGASEFSVRIRRDNVGVMLRRTLDYGYANQRARVWVKTNSGWADAGIWNTAGSTSYYHSWPAVASGNEDELPFLSRAGETAPSQPELVTSDRRLRDEEFLLPVHLTRGKSKLTIRMEFEPRNPPLLPGMAPLGTVWTELEYQVYSYVMPWVE
ncbi:DUF2961 domain-containing protein [Marinicaulis aureus]|uniref:DUF2961 domain-containing protein n=1 Tax=Hyphococcus aureus TaxID=2666033 RepID=A0ABW1KYB6_9PROT